MILTRFFLIIALSITSIQAAELTMSKSIGFDVLTQEYEKCETDALDALKTKAMEDYVGCKIDVSKYDVHVNVLTINDRGITQDTCYVEATLEVNSSYLDTHSYYLGSRGVLCQDINTSLEQNGKSWNAFEIGLFTGLSGPQDAIQMHSSDSTIELEYGTTLMVGLVGNYNHKIFNSQYIGAKIFLAKGFESYTDGETTAIGNNDGTPSILRIGGGAYYGYRYHLKTDFSIGVNYLMDSLTRNYTNNSYKATVQRFNAEASVGYLVLPYLKLWGSVTSDMSASIGVSWVI